MSPSVDPTFWVNKNIVVATVDGFVMPSPHRELTVNEIREIIKMFENAALKAKRLALTVLNF